MASTKSLKNVAPKKVYRHGQQEYYVFANQKEVGIVHAKPRPPYASVEERYMFKAMHELTGSAFKLFMYLCSNKNDYHFALSPVAVGRSTGMSKGSYESAVRQLLEKGYLVHYHDYFTCEDCNIICKDHTKCDNFYTFFPKSKHEMKDVREHIRYCYGTWEKGFKYSPDDHDSSDCYMGDEDSDTPWRSEKFEYYDQE